MKEKRGFFSILDHDVFYLDQLDSSLVDKKSEKII